MSEKVILPKGRLGSIDLLRGVAALAVAVFHVFDKGIFNTAFTSNSFIQTLYTVPISFGYTGVYLFFVISGFCIHLRWAKAFARNDKDFSLDFKAFWKRRIIRLYPAYLVTLAICIGLGFYQGEIKFSSFFIWDVISHLLMIHNFDAKTVYSINGVLWTLAIEEQLYLAYFLLVWLREKFGWKITIAICFSVRIAWFAFCFALNYLFKLQIPVSESSFANWCVWALGAIGIEAALGIIKLPKWLSSLFVASLVLITVSVLEYADFYFGRVGILNKFVWFVSQPLWGIGFFILINNLVNREIKWFKSNSEIKYKDKNFLIKVFVGLGVFSYSLYLTHEIVLHLFKTTEILLVLICIAFAYIFYLAFEKPFIKILEKS